MFCVWVSSFPASFVEKTSYSSLNGRGALIRKPIGLYVRAQQHFVCVFQFGFLKRFVKGKINFIFLVCSPVSLTHVRVSTPTVRTHNSSVPASPVLPFDVHVLVPSPWQPLIFPFMSCKWTRSAAPTQQSSSEVPPGLLFPLRVCSVVWVGQSLSSHPLQVIWMVSSS